MTHTDIINLIKDAGIPCAYGKIKANKPPYCIIKKQDTDNFSADDKVYKKINNYQVELYTSKKSTSTEKKVEDIFDSLNLFYESSEIYLETEKMYQVVYEISLVN